MINNKKSIKRIAWFTAKIKDNNYNPVVFLSSKIVPNLEKKGIEVVVFSENENHYLNAFKIHRSNPFDYFFHQVCEGEEFHFLRSLVGVYPGVTYFHDLYLTDLGPDPLTNSPWAWVSEQLSKDFKVINFPDRTKEFPRQGPLAQREVSLSLSTISSSARFCSDINSCNLSIGNNYFCPYPIEVSCAYKVNFPKQFTVVFWGSPNIEDRVHKFFLALKNLKFNYKVIWFLKPKYLHQAKEKIKEFQIENVTLDTNYNLDNWDYLCKQATVVALLRFSVFGNLSPFLEIAMANKKFSLVCDFADADYYPKESLIKIPAGQHEAYFITESISNLYKQPTERLVNNVGYNFVISNNSIDLVVDNILLALDNSFDKTALLTQRWKNLKHQAQASLSKETKNLLIEPNIFNKEFLELGW